MYLVPLFLNATTPNALRSYIEVIILVILRALHREFKCETRIRQLIEPDTVGNSHSALIGTDGARHPKGGQACFKIFIP